MSALLTPAQAADLLGIEPQTLATWRCRQPRLLAWVEISPRCIRYRPEDIEDFIQKRTRGGVRR